MKFTQSIWVLHAEDAHGSWHEAVSNSATSGASTLGGVTYTERRPAGPGNEAEDSSKVSRTSRDLETGWQPCLAQVHAVATHRNAFLTQKLALPPSLGDTPIGADHAMPWEAFTSGRKNVTDKAGRPRVDVAVRAHKSNWDRTHTAQDAGCPRVWAVVLKRHC
jgi:hypothetical protein